MKTAEMKRTREDEAVRDHELNLLILKSLKEAADLKKKRKNKSYMKKAFAEKAFKPC